MDIRRICNKPAKLSKYCVVSLRHLLIHFMVRESFLCLYVLHKASLIDKLWILITFLVVRFLIF